MIYSGEITWVPAAYRLLQHPGHPTGRHRWYPTCHHGKPPLVLQSSPFPQLNAAGHLHLRFKKGKETTTEQDRDKAYPSVQGVEPFTSQRSSWDAQVPSSPPDPTDTSVIEAHSKGLLQGWLFNWLLQWLRLCCLQTKSWFDENGMWAWAAAIFQWL